MGVHDSLPSFVSMPGESTSMDRLNRFNSELNLVLWAALLLIVILVAGH